MNIIEEMKRREIPQDIIDLFLKIEVENKIIKDEIKSIRALLGDEESTSEEKAEG